MYNKSTADIIIWIDHALVFQAQVTLSFKTQSSTSANLWGSQGFILICLSIERLESVTHRTDSLLSLFHLRNCSRCIIMCKLAITWMIVWLILSITKFFIVIGSPGTYLSRNQHVITWVSNYNNNKVYLICKLP